MTDIIKTEHLTFSYPPDEGKEPVLALKGIDLAIEKGSFTVILGHNGSGKSTLAKHMNAILLPPEGRSTWTVWTRSGKKPCCKSGKRSVWCSKTPITRSSPTWSRRTWPLPRKTWGSRQRRSAGGWTTR